MTFTGACLVSGRRAASPHGRRAHPHPGHAAPWRLCFPYGAGRVLTAAPGHAGTAAAGLVG